MKAAGDEFDALLFSVVMTAVGEDVTYVCSSISHHHFSHSHMWYQYTGS